MANMDSANQAAEQKIKDLTEQLEEQKRENSRSSRTVAALTIFQQEMLRRLDLPEQHDKVAWLMLTVQAL